MQNPYCVNNSKLANIHNLPVWEVKPKPQIVDRNPRLMQQQFGTTRLVTDYPKN